MIEQPKHEERKHRFELGSPGSAAGPIPHALAPSRISVPEAKPVGSAWTEQQGQTWDILVAAMWRGLR